MPSNISSKIELLTDDCVLYIVLLKTLAAKPNHNITSTRFKHHVALGKCLFKSSKCKLLSFTRKLETPTYVYRIKFIPISPASYKYLDFHLSTNLSRITHIESISAAASRALGFLKRNLKVFTPPTSTVSLRDVFAPNTRQCGVSNQHHRKCSNSAARFIATSYSPFSSITAIKTSLSLSPLIKHRRVSRLCLLPKFYYHYSHQSPNAVSQTWISLKP